MLLCLAALVGGAAGEERRERKDVAIPPPPPVPVEIKVERGQAAIIPLRIYGQRNQLLTFLIRKPPRTGQLSDLKNTSATTATIHYRATKDRNVHSDVFEYAVKSVEGVSAAVPVQIEIVDLPAELVGPAEVLFPPQLVGTTEVQTIELVNRGGMATEGQCSVAAPWALESPAAYRVEPGGRLFVKVAFKPEKAGDFLGEVRLSSQPDRSVVLRGIAQDALALKSTALRLALDPATAVRSGVFEVTNNTETAQSVRITGDPRLLHDAELTLERGQTVPVIVRTAAEDAAPLAAALTLTAGEYRASIAVSADPLPALIRPVERVVDLGVVSAGSGPAGQVVLRNFGGVGGSATVSTSDPFQVPPQRVDLAPGATAQVPVMVDGSASGAVEQTLQIRTATATATVPVRAVIVPPGSAPARMSRSSDDQPFSLATPRPSTPMPANVRDLDLAKPDSRQVARTLRREPTRCILDWHVDMSTATRFAVERRELGFQGGNLAAKWLEVPGFKTEVVGDRVRGALENLQPGRHYTVRVLALEDDKRTQIFETSFDTPRPASAMGKGSWMVCLVVAGGAVGALFVWRRRQPRQSRTAHLKKTERIA